MCDTLAVPSLTCVYEVYSLSFSKIAHTHESAMGYLHYLHIYFASSHVFAVPTKPTKVYICRENINRAADKKVCAVCILLR